MHLYLVRKLALGSCWIATSVVTLAQGTNSTQEWNHFGLDFRLGFNLKARFSHLGAAGGQLPPASGGVDHNYSDGFVRVDSSGDRGGSTWNWGYQNASQVTGRDTLEMHSASTPGAALDASEDPRLGFNVDYARDLAQLGSGRWGLKLALGYTDAKIRDSRPLDAAVNLVTDAYPLHGITPPLAPYSGSFSGPGPVIGDTPVHSTTSVPGGALIIGSRQLDAWVYDLRFGPYLEVPLVQRLSIQVGAGVAAGLVDSTFSFSDTTTTSGGTTQSAGSGSSTGALLGFYGEVGLACRVLSRTSVFAGGQFEYLGRFDQTVADRSAELDLRRSLYLMVGLQWQF